MAARLELLRLYTFRVCDLGRFRKNLSRELNGILCGAHARAAQLRANRSTANTNWKDCHCHWTELAPRYSHMHSHNVTCCWVYTFRPKYANNWLKLRRIDQSITMKRAKQKPSKSENIVVAHTKTIVRFAWKSTVYETSQASCMLKSTVRWFVAARSHAIHTAYHISELEDIVEVLPSQLTTEHILEIPAVMNNKTKTRQIRQKSNKK